MKYDNITRAVFLKRPNRFIAEVNIDGHREVVHVKNTGRCKELLIPGCEVWLTAPGTPDRKTKYELAAAVNKGYKAMLAFVIQMDGVSEVRPNIETHAEFGIALDEAKSAGVEVLFLKCHVEPDTLEIIFGE